MYSKEADTVRLLIPRPPSRTGRANRERTKSLVASWPVQVGMRRVRMIFSIPLSNLIQEPLLDIVNRANCSTQLRSPFSCNVQVGILEQEFRTIQMFLFGHQPGLFCIHKVAKGRTKLKQIIPPAFQHRKFPAAATSSAYLTWRASNHSAVSAYQSRGPRQGHKMALKVGHPALYPLLKELFDCPRRVLQCLYTC